MGLDLHEVDLGPGVRAAFAGRAGGVSDHPWSGLNLSLGSGDEIRRVLANRDLLGREIGGPVHVGQQRHGAGVLVVDRERVGRRRITSGGAPDVDALVCALPQVTLGVLVADCLPVLLADPAAGVVATAHAGRRGLVAGIVQATVAVMVEQGAEPSRLRAAIGPAAGACCYEVPAAMRDEVAAQLPGAAASTTWGTPSLDLKAAAAAVLADLGVTSIQVCDVCTVEDERFFSYRRAGRGGGQPVTGRFAGVVRRAAA